MIFNPSSNFCESPEDFTLQHVQQLFVVEPMPHLEQPLVQNVINTSEHVYILSLYSQL